MLKQNDFKALMGVVDVARTQLHSATMKFSELFDDFQGIPKNMGAVEDTLIDTLETLTGNTGLVEYWVYDCSMGEVPCVLTYDNGKEICPATLDELYDVILSKQPKGD